MLVDLVDARVSGVELNGRSPSSTRQRQQRHGLQLVKESPESLPGSALLDFKQHLGSVLSRVETRKDHLEILTNLYEFYDSVSGDHSSVTLILNNITNHSKRVTPAK